MAALVIEDRLDYVRRYAKLCHTGGGRSANVM
jgi:hypothetical protein